MMRKFNYKSDFDFIMRLKDASGKEVPWPECDWDAVFWTASKSNAYRASCIGGECVNCFKEADGGIHFVFDSHRLGMGVLKWEPHFRFPNGIYPDGIQDQFRKSQLGIELVDGDGDEPMEAEIEYILPYIKGDAFTYDDFTAEQIQTLQKPATDAANEAKATEKAVQEAEALRVEAEKKRDISEVLRQSAEQERQTSESTRREQESTRQASETIRQTQEQSRVDAEALRVTAEQYRATEFAGFENDIEEAKMKVFCDLFNASAKNAGYAQITNGRFDCKLNELTLTYEEAQDIYAKGETYLQYAVGKFSDFKGRTVLPLRRGINPQVSYLFNNAKFIEIVNVDLMDVDAGVFKGCTNLRRINGVLQIKKNVTNSFEGCTNLTDIQDLRITANNANIQDSPLLSLATFQQMLQHSSNSTVTVHPDVYAKLTGDTTNEAAAALTADELAQWQTVLTAASAKNISFATV